GHQPLKTEYRLDPDDDLGARICRIGCAGESEPPRRRSLAVVESGCGGDRAVEVAGDCNYYDVTSAWTPVLAASVAVVGTLAAAIFTQVWSARREDRRRADERSDKDLVNEREDRLLLHRERRIAYLTYIKALHEASEA